MNCLGRCLTKTRLTRFTQIFCNPNLLLLFRKGNSFAIAHFVKHFSMLNLRTNNPGRLKEYINISQFIKLIAFLKPKAVAYSPKKSKIPTIPNRKFIVIKLLNEIMFY